MSQVVCEIITVGNELLIGKTLNTNAHWLAKRITVLGGSVARITVVRDDVSEIASSVKEALQRKNSFIITSGGLGPTFDDKTLEGIAHALGVELKVHDEALKMVREKYKKYVEERRMEKVELTPHRLKMAKLPEGAHPLPNPVGTAPGMVFKREETTMVALPGVPQEMEAIFEESVTPLLQRETGKFTFFESSIDAFGVGESSIAPLVDRVMHENPYVYIKSHPKTGEKVYHVELHFSTTAEDSTVAESRVGKALVQLSELIQEIGGKTKPAKPE